MLALEACRLGEAIDPALEAQPVAHQHLGAGQRPRIGRLGLVGVRIAVGPDQGRDVDRLAADLAHQVAQDREGGDDLHPALRPIRSCPGRSGAEQSQEEQGDAHLLHYNVFASAVIWSVAMPQPRWKPIFSWASQSSRVQCTTRAVYLVLPPPASSKVRMPVKNGLFGGSHALVQASVKTSFSFLTT